MPPTHQLATDRNGRRFRRALAWGLAVSAAAHAALFVLWRAPGGPPAGDEEAASAVERPIRPDYLQVVHLPPAPRAAEPVPRPPPPVRARSAEPAPVAVPDGDVRISVSLERPARGGAGSKGGSGAGPGGASHLTPPVPRSVYPEWEPPSSVRGTAVTVRVRVDTLGRPVGPVRLEPPTGDHDFDRRLRQRVLDMRFRPGMLDGRPVEAWAELTFRF